MTNFSLFAVKRIDKRKKALVLAAILLFAFSMFDATLIFAQSSTPQQASPTQSSTPPPAQPAQTPPSSAEGMPTPQQMQQDAREAGVSHQQMREMGIDPSKPEQALERARELGVPESQIQDYLRQYQADQGQQTQDTQTPGMEQLGTTEQKASDVEPTVEEAAETPEDEILDIFGEELGDATDQDGESELPGEGDLAEFRGIGRFAGLEYVGYRTLREGFGRLGSLDIGPIDPGYLISRGDVLRIYVWGEQQFQYEFAVSQDGSINVPNVGPIFVAGTRFDALQDKLRRSFSRFYSTLTTSPPRSFIEVSLAQPRGKNVYLMGNVRDSRTFNVSSFATVFNLLYATGGPTVSGSLRDVRVIRENKVFATVDMYASLVKGSEVQDVRLLENDLVFVPPRGKTVAIDGPVLRPGIYEMRGKETLRDLIDFAGRPAPSTYSFRAQIDRIVPFEERVKAGEDRRLLDINLADVLSGKKSVELVDGDRVTLFPFSDLFTQYVTIRGLGILRPGVYELGEILRLKDLVIAADSLTGDAYLAKADIRRIRLDYTEEFISVDLLKAMQGDPAHNLVLWPQDQVRIYAETEWRPSTTVQLGGYVAQPGTYAYAEFQTLYDLLFAHSGLQDSVRYGRTQTSRGDLLRRQPDGRLYKIVEFNLSEVWNQSPDADIRLLPGDRVVLYERARFQPTPRVVLEGHVKRPGTYTYLDDLTIGDLIFLHSGFEDSVYYARSYQKRLDIFRLNPDGRTRHTISLPTDHIWAGGEAASYPLLPEDVVRVYEQSILEIESYSVTLAGMVNSPGTYRLRKEMTLADLLLLGDGFLQEAWLFEVELTRYDLIGLPGDSIAITRRIPLHLEHIATDTPDDVVRKVIEESEHLSNFFLKPMDRITILNNPNFRQPRFVSVQGEVRFPGEYSLRLLDEKLSSVIRRAGGVTDIAHLRGAQLIRDGRRINIDFYELIEKKNKREDIVLLPGDSLTIPEEPGTVAVDGLVYNPGLYKYRSGKRVKQYVKEAGGTLEDAGDIFVTYASGRSLKVDFWTNPKVYDGARIEVRPIPPKPEEDKGEPLDITAVAKETMTLLASALTIIVLATRLN